MSSLPRKITTTTSDQEAEEIRTLNMLADAIVRNMKERKLAPESWDEIKLIVQKRINNSTHVTWKE